MPPSRRLVAVFVLISGVWGCGGPASGQAGARATTTAVRDSIGRRPFDRVLRRFVDRNGRVDYDGLRAAADTTLVPYLRRLATTDVSALGREARLAFWINAYNALTLKLIIDHYPVPNIWAVTPGPAEPKENSPFKQTVGTVADTARTLDEIEHEIIRERFEEPRIHFALVCAARSCPPLRREAYTGARLDRQLDEQARSFFHDESKNRIPAAGERVSLSRILKWYGDDFGPTTDALQRTIAPYFEGRVRRRLASADYEVTYLPYDWSLNDQAGGRPAPSNE